MRRQGVPIVVAILFISLLAASLFGGIPYLGILFLGFAVGAFMFLGATLMRGGSEKKYTDPYDLDLFRDIDERERDGRDD